MANEANRRDAPAEVADAKLKQDEYLAKAKQYPESFMLGDPEILELGAEGNVYDLVITSARDEEGNRGEVHIRSRCVRIFRADPTVDEFTSQGGMHWRFRNMPGKVMLKRPGLYWLSSGPIVMAVREEQTIRFYTMMLDFRY
jgi:hypothetical protein